LRPAAALILRCHSRESVWPCIEVDRREGRNIPAGLSFYASIFKISKIRSIHCGGKTGGVMGGTFQLEGQEFHALNGGPLYKFTPVISFYVDCET
jgi:predicted 3-demethylubiquinone-9 3-methyltransferase (glyoxalase superfamily)